jgi:SAM-dependent methyltransferase
VCPLCDAPRRFTCRDHDSEAADLREGLVCAGCGTNARVRAALAILQMLCPDRAAPVYLTEQVSSAYGWLRRHRSAVSGSEFPRGRWQQAMLTARLWKRGAFENVRREDVTGLSFADASQHAVASFDVLEHVPDDRAALREFARVTAAGGWLVLTVPFTGDAQTTERAHVHADGRIEHLLAPEYHGNPLGGGALCLRHYGWDLLDALRAAGYRQSAVAFPWWPEAGLFEGLAILVAQR